MADAFVIQSADLTAGIVVVERGGVRFYASDRNFHELDGKIFKNVRAARQAVDGMRRGAPSPHRPHPLSAHGQAA
ncbi:MAG: hypothetical protein WCC64_15040 [Aliidongia sp.]